MPSAEQALIAQYKKHLRQTVILAHADVDCATAHGRLGEAARTQIHKLLARRLEMFGPARALEQFRRARKYQAALRAKLQIPELSAPLYAAGEMYIASLAAWAAGAQLAAFQHPFIAEALDGAPITALDLAFFLQEDEVGCQTGTYRDRDGAIILWHTEEDYEEQPGARFDQLRLFSFRAYEERVATAFIYPDLLPGPACAWQTEYFIQAVDSLHPRDANLPNSILPNTLAWLSLYLGTSVTRDELVGELGPFAGGYSLTALHRIADEVGVEKIEFANAQYHVSHLEETAGCYLFQTNIVADASLPVAAEEETAPENRAYNLQRVTRTERMLRTIQQADDILTAFLRMLCTRGGDGAYSNHDVKGYLICRVRADQFTIWVGSGPAMEGDELLTINSD